MIVATTGSTLDQRVYGLLTPAMLHVCSETFPSSVIVHPQRPKPQSIDGSYATLASFHVHALTVSPYPGPRSRDRADTDAVSRPSPSALPS